MDRVSSFSPASVDTIAAIATPPGRGAIGILRLSGPRAVEIANQLFRPDSVPSLAERPSHTLSHGHVTDGAQAIDEVLAAVMRAPHSYTGEDVVEFYCHGSPVVLRAVLEAAVAGGARPAEPGEFTRRAFLNGRIDLTQAEAVADVIAAPAEQSRRAAVRLLDGGLRQRLEGLSRELERVLAELEAGIDFADEMDEETTPDTLCAALHRVRERCELLLRTAHTVRMIHDGCRVAIAGRPNVGKSSLLNLIAREERALVTDIPGTTRDTLDVDVAVRGFPVRFTDTAGLRRARGTIERHGIARAERALGESDVVCWVVDRSRRPARGEIDAIEAQAGKFAMIVVLNKSDLPAAWSNAQQERLRKRMPVVCMSALQGSGLDMLEEALYGLIGGGSTTAEDDVIIVRARQSELLRRAVAALARAAEQRQVEWLPELIAADVREARDALGELTGRITSEDILDLIFSEFCIGK